METAIYYRVRDCYFPTIVGNDLFKTRILTYSQQKSEINSSYCFELPTHIRI